MYCDKCNGLISVKNAEHFISLKCKCEIVIVYADKTTKIVARKEFIRNYKEVQNHDNKKRPKRDKI